jgi:general secretion pathway protein D
MRYLLFLTTFSSILCMGALSETNASLSELKDKLKEKYDKASQLYTDEAETNSYGVLKKEIAQIKNEIQDIQEKDRKHSVKEQDEEDYAIWDLGEVTLAEFVMEFGSTDYVYVIPSSIGGVKLHVYSTLSIPRASWNEMVDLILSAHGVGVRQINTYTKLLYLSKQNPSQVDAICGKKTDLYRLPPEARVFYLFSPELDQLQGILAFLEKFSDPREIVIHSTEGQIILVGSTQNVQRLVQLYETVWKKNKDHKNAKVVSLKKIAVKDAEAILQAYFPQNKEGKKQKGNFLEIFPLEHGIVLIGPDRAIQKAENIISNLEGQLAVPEEKIVYWYTCKHSAPESLAETLEKVYASLTDAAFLTQEEGAKTNQKNHFIVDQKTGSLCMVIKKDQRDSIQSILKKLDVPKKMVQIDVLLVEKKQRERGSSGINLLQLGASSGKKQSALHFDTNETGFRKGILDFIFSRKKGKFPAFDLTYSFLMAQENVKINANPSILAINQTPATISIVEEISINNGAVQFDSGHKTSLEKSFTRSQYGTTLVLTPTIHLPDPEGGIDQGFITLQTNITFDTAQSSTDDRPPVTKRHIENEVRIADGETIILGGLKRSSSEESTEKIPFLGEIPGIGKLFSNARVSDTNTEMFIFITPHIIKDPVEDLHKLRLDELQKRPGDIPSFLDRLDQARNREKKKLFEDSMKLLFRHTESHVSTR